jgi:hypothetical protein
MKEVQYDLNIVIGHLSAKIANLEAQLAHAQAINEAYVKRIEELESKLKLESNLKEQENAE